ncbi:MAG TPA: flagellar basal-body MS-ring/collar protein FliF [Terriglobia bacterium]|nr:flagellar basal-body MS-ring/collar protein FliF [Terriglobia bacterium]
MAFDTNQVTRQITTFFKGLTRRQRVILGSSVALAAIALYAFVSLMGSGEYQTLYTNLSPDEGANLVQHLAARGITAQLSSDGTSLSVAAGKAARARLDLAAEGLPRSGHLGFEIFDKPNWAGSDFVEQVNYQRALEGELEKTIESMSGIEAVRVHLAMAHDSLFTEQQRDAKAAVMVKLHPGARLSDDDLSAITFLVSSAVDNMKPEDVRVMDADGHVPLLSHHSTHPEEAQELEAALSQKIVDTLGPLAGPGQVRANVTVEYENGSNESTQESYDTNDSVVLTSQMTADDATFAASTQGVPGSTSNVPQAQGQQPPKAPVADTKIDGIRNENKTFGVGKTVRHTVLPPGGIRRISAAVIVDDAIETTTQNNKKVETRRKRTPDEMKQIQELASAAIGINPTRGDQLAVVNMSFNANATDNPAPPTLSQRIPNLINQWMPVLRYVGYGIVFMLMYLLILRPLKKQLTAGFTVAPALPEASVAAAALEAPAPVEAALPEAPEPNPMTVLKEKLTQRVVNEPVQTSRLVQDWLRQR